MADESRLLAGSYKGIELLIDSSTINGGRKTAKHSFPNRDTNIVEDLGALPRSYSFQAIITERPASTYSDYRNEILQVLDAGGKGDFIHPFYGRIADVVATSYSISESIGEYGSAILSISFEIDGNRGIPQDSGNLASKIEQAAAETQALGTDAIAEDFSISARFNANFDSALESANDFIDAGNQALQGIDEISDAANELAADLGDLAANTLSLLNSPQRLAESIGSVFDGIGAAFSSNQAALNGFLSFFGFGGGDLPAPTTAGLIERANNQRILDGAINAAALCNAYSQAVQIEYETEDDIEVAAATLDDQYQLIITSDADQDLKDALTDMRVDVVAAFNAARLTASKIVTVPVLETSVRLLAFDYYGNDDNGLTIASLNNVQDASSISGQVKLVTV